MGRSHPAVIAIGIAVLLGGCGVTIPSDPNGTLERVEDAVLRVGASPNGELVIERDGTFAGKEVDLVAGFAHDLDADIEWTLGSEEALVRGIERGELDLVIGGITDQTPWIDRVGATRPYATVRGTDDHVLSLVMLVPAGENRFLSTLERYLDEAVPQ